MTGVLGILRHSRSCENSYFLLAEQRQGDVLRNAFIYHDSESYYPWPQRRHYGIAILDDGGKLLTAPKAPMRLVGTQKGVIFGGEDAFDIRPLPNGSFARITNHDDDIGFLTEGLIGGEDLLGREMNFEYVQRLRERLAEYSAESLAARVELCRLQDCALELGVPLNDNRYNINHSRGRIIHPI